MAKLRDAGTLIPRHLEPVLYDLYASALWTPSSAPLTLRERLTGWRYEQAPFRWLEPRRRVSWRLWLMRTRLRLERQLSWRRILHDFASPHGEWCDRD